VAKPKRKSSTDELAAFQGQWIKSQSKMALKNALRVCAKQKLAEPTWLHDAFYKIGRYSVEQLRGTGNKMNLYADDIIYATVQEYIDHGCTQEVAWEKARVELLAEWGWEMAFDTVRNTWGRHGKRIIKSEESGWGWKIKPEYLERSIPVDPSSKTEPPGFRKGRHKKVRRLDVPSPDHKKIKG